jgi:hypothetical protein
LTASIGGATTRRLNASHAHNKRPWPKHVTTSGTPGGNITNGQKPCCMCGDAHEDWRHIITCKSFDASLHRKESSTKVKKTMKAWRIPRDFWIAIEKGINHYAAHPLKRDKEDTPPLNHKNLLVQRSILRATYYNWHSGSSRTWVGRTFSKGEYAQNGAHTSNITPPRAISRKTIKNCQKSLY